MPSFGPIYLIHNIPPSLPFISHAHLGHRIEHVPSNVACGVHARDWLGHRQYQQDILDGLALRTAGLECQVEFATVFSRVHLLLHEDRERGGIREFYTGRREVDKRKCKYYSLIILFFTIIGYRDRRIITDNSWAWSDRPAARMTAPCQSRIFECCGSIRQIRHINKFQDAKESQKNVQ